MKKRDIAFEILETLKKEGVDLSKIKTNVQLDRYNSRRILLKEMNVEGIDSFIKKYNWDPNFTIGNQIDVMRKTQKNKNPKINERIDALNIRKTAIYSKEGLEAIINILEQLRAEGVDIEFIPKKENFKYIKLGEIDTPNTREILEKLNLSEDYPIGKRIELLLSEYSNDNNVRLYEHTPEEYERIRKLGLGYSYEEQIFNTLEVLRKLELEGVDVSSANDMIIDKNGKRRIRYLFELNNPNIEEIMKKLNLPRFYLLEKRINQVKYFVNAKKHSKEIRNKARKELVDLGLMLEIKEDVVRENLDLLQKLKEHGVDTDRKYEIGRALNRIYNIAKNDRLLENYNLTQSEKAMIIKLYQSRLNELKNNSISETLRLIELLEGYNIDLNDYSLKPFENGIQRSLRLCDLPLTEEQLKYIERDLGYKPDFNLGNRIINIKSSIGGKGRLSFTDEQLEKMKKLKIFEIKHHKISGKPDFNDIKIEFLKTLRDEGIDLGTLKLTYTLNHKNFPLTLGMLDISEEKLNEIKQKFNIDENFKLLNWFGVLRRNYRKGFLTSEQEENLENLGIISKLDKLEARQRELQSRLDRADRLERQVDTEISKRDVNNIE